MPGELVHSIEISSGLRCKVQPGLLELSRYMSPRPDGMIEPMEDASQEKSMDRERMGFCRRELVFEDVLANPVFSNGLDVKAKDGEQCRRRMERDKAQLLPVVSRSRGSLMKRDVDTMLDEEAESRGIAVVIFINQVAMAG
jgi:hypothetical protein